MKLYKEGPGDWAIRFPIDTVDDLDIEVQEFSCGKVITTVRIASRECTVGIMSSFDYDGTLVQQFGGSQEVFKGSGRIDRGCVKLYSWNGKPTKLTLGDFRQIQLEYENQ